MCGKPIKEWQKQGLLKTVSVGTAPSVAEVGYIQTPLLVRHYIFIYGIYDVSCILHEGSCVCVYCIDRAHGVGGAERGSGRFSGVAGQ